ncbi:MAG: FAD-binding oxidoreductase [Flavitalea sp.]
MMNVDFLVIGQGISGSFVSWYLQKAGSSFLVIDKADAFSSSRVAAGIINPVTGRRIVQTWMIDTLLGFALNAYTELGTALNLQAIAQKNIIDFFPAPQMLLSFRKRFEEDPAYLSFPQEQNGYAQDFNYDFGFGEIAPCYAVNLAEILPAWRKKLGERSQLLEDHFDHSQLTIEGDGIRYQDIHAQKIIFCDGSLALENPWFNKLPFAYNKGEALLIRQEGLPADKIFKKGMNIVPVSENIFWSGSSYEWNFSDALPSEIFRQKTIGLLKHWLKRPFEVIDHLAAVRPATIERRPFVGIHPHHPQLAILNGMGTKGCSLAPYFADQLVNLLTKNTPVLKEADIKRFSRILGL